MNNALTISGLTKTYKDFVLDSVSFDVPEGSIVGLIGENGAGKSTTINAVMGLIKKDAGHISIMGKEELDNDTKEQIGVVFDGSNYPEILSPKRLNRVMKNMSDIMTSRTMISGCFSSHIFNAVLPEVAVKIYLYPALEKMDCNASSRSVSSSTIRIILSYIKHLPVRFELIILQKGSSGYFAPKSQSKFRVISALSQT